MEKARVIEGTCEEIRAVLDRPEMAGRQLKLIILPSEEPSNPLLDQAVLRLTRRTPEEIAAARERAIAAYPPERPLPSGKTFAETLAGEWPGEETDEQIEAALSELS